MPNLHQLLQFSIERMKLRQQGRKHEVRPSKLQTETKQHDLLLVIKENIMIQDSIISQQ